MVLCMPINVNSHRRTWRVDVVEAVRSSPCVTEEGIYFGCESGEFLKLDFRGEIKWRFRAKRAITASPAESQGVIFFSSLDSNIYALDTKSGWVIWRFRMGKGTVSSPCVSDKYVYVGFSRRQSLLSG